METIKSCIEKGGIFAVLAHQWMMFSWPRNGRCEHKPSNYLEELERHEGRKLCLVAAESVICRFLFHVAVCIFVFWFVAAVYEYAQGYFPGHMFYINNIFGLILCLVAAGLLSKLSCRYNLAKEMSKHEKIMSEYNVELQFGSDFEELKTCFLLPQFGFKINERSVEELARRFIRTSIMPVCVRIVCTTDKDENDSSREYCIVEMSEYLSSYKKFGMCTDLDATAFVDATIREFQERNASLQKSK